MTATEIAIETRHNSDNNALYSPSIVNCRHAGSTEIDYLTLHGHMYDTAQRGYNVMYSVCSIMQ